MGLFLIPVFAEDSCEVEICEVKCEAHFFMCLTYCAGMWALADIRLELTSWGAEKPLIWFLIPL
jgi:hypothetical protein